MVLLFFCFQINVMANKKSSKMNINGKHDMQQQMQSVQAVDQKS